MRWKTFAERIKPKTEWHDWFAWYPVEAFTDNGCTKMQVVWMETVERIGEYSSGYAQHGWDWTYRAKTSK